MTEIVEISVTCPDRDAALRIAQALLEARLAACCNLGGEVFSRYRWKGAIEEAGETLLSVKTRAALFDGAAALIRAHHPYDTPAILGHEVRFADAATREWIAEATKA